MRISGGHLKGRKIAAQRKVFAGKNETDELRPTSSKVREALFDILRNDTIDAIFLDLYAGTGTVGFEALSRGAGQVYFVEENKIRYSAIQDSINKIGLGDRAFAQKQQASDFLKRASLSGLRFDIIFVDPPYASDEINRIFPLMDMSGVLKEGGCVIIEHSSRKVMPKENLLDLIKNYRYGDTTLTLYRKA